MWWWVNNVVVGEVCCGGRTVSWWWLFLCVHAKYIPLDAHSPCTHTHIVHAPFTHIHTLYTHTPWYTPPHPHTQADADRIRDDYVVKFTARVATTAADLDALRRDMNEKLNDGDVNEDGAWWMCVGGGCVLVVEVHVLCVCMFVCDTQHTRTQRTHNNNNNNTQHTKTTKTQKHHHTKSPPT